MEVHLHSWWKNKWGLWKNLCILNPNNFIYPFINPWLIAVIVELNDAQPAVLKVFNWLWRNPRDFAIWEPTPSHIIAAKETSIPNPAPLWEKNKIKLINSAYKFQLKRSTYDRIGRRNEHAQGKDSDHCSVNSSIKTESGLWHYGSVNSIIFWRESRLKLRLRWSELELPVEPFQSWYNRIELLLLWWLW